MPYRDSQTRLRKYELGVIPANVEAKFTALKPLMVDLQEARQAEIVMIESCVRSKLDDYGIIGNSRIPYLNFVRSIYHHAGAQGGVALQKLVSAEKAKWTEMGFDASVLDDVASCVTGAKAY
jgi:hypothetical protein